MSDGKDDFAARIRRIEEARGQGAAAPPPAAGTSAPRRTAPPALLVGIAVLIACAVGLALASGVATGLPGIPGTAGRAGGQDDLAEAQAPGAMRQLLSLVTDRAGSPATAPLDFLPPAPDGWFRVTASDVKDAGFLAGLRADWPATAGGGTAVPLDQHAGYPQIRKLTEDHASPDAETAVLARKRTWAAYLHPDGKVLYVALEFRDKVNALGAKDDPRGWTDALVELLEKDRKPDEVVERLQLAGLQVANRTQPTGQSLVARPIGTDIYAPTGFRIAVALTNRAMMEIEGIAMPKTAETMIAAMDRTALSARLK